MADRPVIFVFVVGQEAYGHEPAVYADLWCGDADRPVPFVFHVLHHRFREGAEF
jgi:hypothetical protein